ncbi:MAG: Ig-like domain-containing protein [Gemmatimonadales bacterium]|nr:Ig-like domain-containing protein [Gemmatimonadales bacterium]
MPVLALLLLLQQPAPPTQLPPSPIAKLVIAQGNNVTMTAQDTLRLVATPVDSAGAPVAGARVSFTGQGAYFEAQVDPTGLIRSGSTGAFNVLATAIVPGSRPVRELIRVTMVAGPAARIAVSPTVGSVIAGQRLRLEAKVYSRAGDQRADRVQWSSSAPTVASVRADGVLDARAAGTARITAKVGAVEETVPVTVLPNTIASFKITPEATEARAGDVVRFTVVATDRAGKQVTGFTPQWAFSPGQGMVDADGSFVGYEAGTYLVTASIGTRSAEATVTLKPRDVRRPATVVGRLPRTRFTTEEVWIHPSGKYAYLGSGSGGDVLFAVDISDPSKPTVTDSIVVNTRRINDVMSTPDGKYLVFTREGASDRKNGIVIASAEDPAHPKVIAEYTATVTAGVHSAFIHQQEKFGTHVYLTNDGTGAMHVIDISDPYHPKEVAVWKTDRPDAGRSLHDIDVQNGLMYASYWNDGLVILDVGNGIKGGSPSNPQLVSQFKYDLNALYRDVEASGGPGFIRGTHTAWRHKNYVFIADEVFPASGVRGAKDASAGRAYGRLQVVDISDITKPKSVAWYEPEYGGVHNVWVAGDTLYMGAYNAGFRAFDVSGELKGDLRAQGREMVHVNTADMDGKVQNTAMTWGVVVNPKDGLAYVNDMYNGLWIVRLEPRRRELTP